MSALTVGLAAKRLRSSFASSTVNSASQAPMRACATFSSTRRGAVVIRSASLSLVLLRPPTTAVLLGVFRGRFIPHLYRPSLWQGNPGFKAGLVVGEGQFAAMQARYSRGKAQAKPGAWFGTALFQSDEPFDRTSTIGLGNAGPAIRNHQENPVALTHGAHDDFCRRAVFRVPTRLCILDGVVDQVSEGLTYKFSISSERHRRVSLYFQSNPFFLRQGLIELANIVSDFCCIEFAHIFPCLTGFRTGDH